MPSTNDTTPPIPGLPDLTALPGERQPTPEQQAEVAKLLSTVQQGGSERERGQAEAATSAAEWKRKKREGFVVTLPSGNNAKVARKIDLIEAFRRGELPNSLAGVVSAMMSGSNITQDMLKESSLFEMMDWINEQVAICMIEPRVVIPPADGKNEDGSPWECPEDAIEISDVDIADRMFLAGVAQGGPAQFDNFRAQTELALAATQFGQGVQPEA